MLPFAKKRSSSTELVMATHYLQCHPTDNLQTLVIVVLKQKLLKLPKI